MARLANFMPLRGVGRSDSSPTDGVKDEQTRQSAGHHIVHVPKKRPVHVRNRGVIRAFAGFFTVPWAGYGKFVSGVQWNPTGEFVDVLYDGS